MAFFKRLSQLAFISHLFIFQASGQECKHYEEDLKSHMLKNNHVMKISPNILIKKYNALVNCDPKVTRPKEEQLIKDFAEIDSLYCKFKKRKTSREDKNDIKERITELYEQNKKADTYYVIFENYKIEVCEDADRYKVIHYCDNQIPIRSSIFRNQKSPTTSSDKTIIDDTSNINTNELYDSKKALTVHQSESTKTYSIDSTILKKERILTLTIPDGGPNFEQFIFNPAIFLTSDSSMRLDFCFVQPGSYNIGITPEQYRKVMMDAGERAFELNVQDEVSKKENRYIKIETPFYISKYELSIGQMRLLLNENIKEKENSQIAANNLKEEDIGQLLKRLNDYYKSVHFDLPTETQWEYAAKGPANMSYMSTDDFFEIKDMVKVNDTTGVGSILSDRMLCSWTNACNMIGNIKEICYASHDYYTSEFNTHTKYVARGGSYVEDHFSARTTSRHPRSNINSPDIGIRLVITKK